MDCALDTVIGALWVLAIVLILIGWFAGWRLVRGGREYPRLRIVLYAIAVAGLLYWTMEVLFRFSPCSRVS